MKCQPRPWASTWSRLCIARVPSIPHSPQVRIRIRDLRCLRRLSASESAVLCMVRIASCSASVCCRACYSRRDRICRGSCYPPPHADQCAFSCSLADLFRRIRIHFLDAWVVNSPFWMKRDCIPLAASQIVVMGSSVG